MSNYDTFHGKCTLPDGRVVEATVYGSNIHDTWFVKGGFEIAEHDPLEIDTIDGEGDFDDSEYDHEYIVDGNVITLSEYVIDYLCEHGTFEAWEPDYDD